jgi:hypothetical protein
LPISPPPKRADKLSSTRNNQSIRDANFRWGVAIMKIISRPLRL